MTKQLKDAALIALDALDIAQALMEASRSNHHAKTLAAYNALRLALAAPQPEQAEPIEDPVTVPRGLLGAACYALRHPLRNNDATVETLRRYTVGDLSAAAAPQPAEPSAIDYEREACAMACEEVATWAGTTWRNAALDCAKWVRARKIRPAEPSPQPVPVVGASAPPWRLWRCNQETGRDWLVKSSTDEAWMRSLLDHALSSGADAWLVSPKGEKITSAGAAGGAK